MMALEGPYLAAIIARLPQAKYNLAAYGVAAALAVLVESPVIMLMSASTALVDDGASYRKLRNFTAVLCAITTGGMALIILPPVARLTLHVVVGLPEDLSDLTRRAMVLLLPWPAAIGYRRFYQGLLIRSGSTRLVAAGTLVRLSTMTIAGLALAFAGSLPGVMVGAGALSCGVIAEAIVARTMARKVVRDLGTAPVSAASLSYGRITSFYLPLALTSVVGLTLDPLLTFFMGRSRLPVESLALYPVVDAFSFLFRALGVSFQEAAIALLGDGLEHLKEVTRFAFGMGITATAALGLMVATPLASLWYRHAAGLSPELAGYALAPTAILVVMPLLTVYLSLQRGILVKARRTPAITVSTLAEILAVAAAFMALDRVTGWIGVTVAMTAFVAGRCTGISVQLRAVAAALKLKRLDPAGGAI